MKVSEPTGALKEIANRSYQSEPLPNPYRWATLGRFTSPDAPFADQYPEDPQSWNLYSYVRNNPLTNTDPSGNACVHLNGSRTDVESVDDQISSEQCGKAGGYWVDGTVTEARFAHGSLFLAGTTNGENRTSASYGLGPDAGLMALQRGVMMAEPGVSLAGKGLLAASIVLGGGIAYGAVAGGPAIYSLGIAAGPLLPAVPSALEKLQKLGMTLEQANQVIQSPTSQKLVDNLHGGNINVLQIVGDKVVRITLDPTGRRIISAGLMRANSVKNGIDSGRFTPRGK